jgi:two-component system sensor histidine kinase/response regulator
MERLEEVYRLVGEKIHEMVGDGYAAVSMFDEKQETARLVGYYGFGSLLTRLSQLFGLDSDKALFHLKDMTEAEIKKYRSGKLETIDDGLYALFTRKTPKSICDRVQQLLGFTAVYFIGFVWHGIDYGGLTLLTKADITPYQPMIEMIMNQAAITINRIRVEETLAEERSLLHTLMDNIPDVIYFKDAGSRFTRVNQAQAQRLGLVDPAQLLGKTDFDYFTDEHARLAFANEQAILRTGQPLIGKEEMETFSDGRVAWVSTTKMALRDSSGQIIGTFGLSRDISEQKQTEALRLAKETAEAASKAKSEFLASMSHELRTPLNAIIGFSDMLEQLYYGPLTPKQAEYVSEIHESGKHLLSLINDILDLSKVEAGKMELYLSEVPLKEVLAHSLTMIREKAANHNLRLGFYPSPEIESLSILADERKLLQIMINLLSNAAKFTPDGGAIDVLAWLVKEEAGQDGKWVEICVADTGVGLEQADLARVFEHFYQVKTPESAKTPGTGLGLSLVRRMVELHGGKVWAESDGRGKGSRFVLRLPVETPAG